MSWRDRLTKASFRGFDFLTESHEARYGRRLVVHEYPKADVPEVEDFGLKAKQWKLNAYFIGENYDLEANGFLAKLAEAGAEWLQHPWLGRLWVRAADWTRSESNDQGGYCVVTIEFVPGGRAPFEPAVDKVDVAYSRVREFKDIVVEEFELEPMTGGELTGIIADVQQHLEHLRKAISLATLPLTWVNQVLTLVQGVKSDVGVLLGIPSQYAIALENISNVLGLGGDDASVLTNETRLRAITRITSTAINPPAIVASPVVSSSFNVNVARESAMRSQQLIAAAAQLAIADYDDSITRDSVLDRLLSAIDTQLPNMSDAVFGAAVEMRTALINVLMDQDLDASTVRDIATATPAVVLAYQAGIDEVFFTRKNNVRHPLFVQGRVYG